MTHLQLNPAFSYFCFMRMKIGFDAKRAFLNASGLGNYSRNTLNALNRYFPENKYLLFTPETETIHFPNAQQFQIVSPSANSSRLQKSYWRNFSISKKFHDRELDIFHGLSNELPRGIHKTDVKSVVTIHDLIFLRYPKYYNALDRKIYFYKVRYACTAATKIIAISEQTKNDIVEFLNIKPEKIEVVHQSVSPVFFESDLDKNLKSKYNLPDDFILSVGTIETRKNQLTLLKALHEQQLETPVVFVGKPTSYKNELLLFIDKKKLKNKILFLENIPENDLAGLYQLAIISVYLSRYEGFGLPIIEAMASGCPVMTGNVSCLPETAGDAAILCTPEYFNEVGEQLKIVLENEKVRTDLIAKGKERAKRFRPEIYAGKLISLYGELQK